MIDVLYNEKEFCLTVKGHAGYCERGHDIVCAGVSGICEALVGTAIDRCSKVLPVISQHKSEGSLRIKLYPEGERNKSIGRLMLDMAYIGLERIEAQFMGYIQCSRTKEDI